MAIHKFKDGSVLATGKDIYDMLLPNRRNGYKKECAYCIHRDEKSLCDDCSRNGGDSCCSCHINPPCSFCERDAFEPTSLLINFKNYSAKTNHRRWSWETFPVTDVKVIEKMKTIEDNGYVLSAEILSTGEIAIYLDFDNESLGEEDSIEICEKVRFKETAIKMINTFKV